MNLVVERVDVWAAQIADEPGALANLLDVLQESGANLQSIIARRLPEPGKAVVYVAPLRGDREIAVAAQLGFNLTHSLHSMRVLGPNRPGIAAEITLKVAEAGINLRGFSASAIGDRFAAYFALDTVQDANRLVGVMELYDASHA